jgi:hypothetical protein
MSTYERIIFISVFQKQDMRDLELPSHASPRRCSDNRTKASKYAFESHQPFAVPIGPESVAELCECTIHITKFPFMIPH